MPEISVIVPVYKVEDYLRRCVDSVLNQTYRNIEVILVDDGSPDGCGKICDEYAKHDSRVRVIHKENQGVGAARNTGLDAARGEYIAFVDSDDYVRPEMLELLLEQIQRKNVRLSVCGYRWTSGEPLEKPVQEPEAQLWEPEAFQEKFGLLAVVPWGKLYHRSCFDGIRYPSVRYADDEYVTYRIIYDCPRIAMTEGAYYAHLENFSSLTHRSWSPRNLEVLPAFDQQIIFYKSRGVRKMYERVIRTEMNYIAEQLGRIGEEDDPAAFLREKKFLKKKGKALLRRYRKEKLFSKGDYWRFFSVFHEKTYGALKKMLRIVKRT